MGLGPLHTVSLKDARDRAQKARLQLLDGIDPLDARKAARAALALESARSLTFEQAAQQYFDAHERKWRNAKHRQQFMNTLKTYTFPVIGKLPMATIDTGLVLKCIEPIWREQHFSITGGSPRTYDAISRGSGQRVTLHFCDVCGTKTHQTMERFGGVVGVYGGSLDDPSIANNANEVWRIFLDDAAAGTVIPANVNVWSQHRLDSTGSPLDPAMFAETHIVT